MAEKTAVVQVSADKTIPKTFVGKIPPNYYCRGLNRKGAKKYCRSRAGFRTVHPGEGRCFMHGGQQEGDKRVTHGRFVTVKTEEIRELMEQLAENADPLNVTEDLLIARAFL